MLDYEVKIYICVTVFYVSVALQRLSHKVHNNVHAAPTTIGQVNNVK